MHLTQEQISSFQQFIWQFYAVQGRKFAWRFSENPYAIVVSEIMLQQTQTYRVEPKFEQFMITFPDFASLADAPLRDLLFVWQGLGYSRRALALQKIAQRVVGDFGGELPNSPEILDTFPGIGKATAASICAFAFNAPSVFIETNIRTVFIHSFFKQDDAITDKQLMPLVAQTVDATNPREWYYALMDYGVHLKKMCSNPSRRSAHHTKQSKFKGSDREIRGMIIKKLTMSSMQKNDLLDALEKDHQRVQKILTDLCNEGFIKQHGEQFSIT